MVRSSVVQFAAIAALLVGCGGSGGGGSGGSGGAGGKATGGHAGGTGGAAGAATGGTAGSVANGGAAGHANGGNGGGANGGNGGGANGGAGGHALAGAGGGGVGGSAGGVGGGAAGSGGQAGGAGAAGGAGGAAACNSLVNSATVVNKDHDPGAPPAMTGGTIVAGTYTLTKMVQYNGENGNTAHQETFVFSNGTFQAVTLQGRFSGTYSVSGTNLTLNVTCPATQTVVMPYTASATQVVTINQDDPNEAHTMTLQTGTPTTCSSLIVDGPAVPEVMGSGSAPTPAGGTITGGTYVLSGWTVYSPATANTSQSRKLTLQITGSNIELQGIDANGATLNLAGTLSSSGTTVTTTWTCGASGSVAQAYTVSNNQLMIFDPRDGGIALETWDRQP